jgi:hypothetical protein
MYVIINMFSDYAATGVSSVTRRTPVVIVRTATIAANIAIFLSSFLFAVTRLFVMVLL